MAALALSLFSATATELDPASEPDSGAGSASSSPAGADSELMGPLRSDVASASAVPLLLNSAMPSSAVDASANPSLRALSIGLPIAVSLVLLTVTFLTLARVRANARRRTGLPLVSPSDSAPSMKDLAYMPVSSMPSWKSSLTRSEIMPMPDTSNNNNGISDSAAVHETDVNYHAHHSELPTADQTENAKTNNFNLDDHSDSTAVAIASAAGNISTSLSSLSSWRSSGIWSFVSDTLQRRRQSDRQSKTLSLIGAAAASFHLFAPPKFRVFSAERRWRKRNIEELREIAKSARDSLRLSQQLQLSLAGSSMSLDNNYSVRNLSSVMEESFDNDIASSSVPGAVMRRITRNDTDGSGLKCFDPATCRILPVLAPIIEIAPESNMDNDLGEDAAAAFAATTAAIGQLERYLGVLLGNLRKFPLELIVSDTSTPASTMLLRPLRRPSAPAVVGGDSGDGHSSDKGDPMLESVLFEVRFAPPVPAAQFTEDRESRKAASVVPSEGADAASVDGGEAENRGAACVLSLRDGDVVRVHRILADGWAYGTVVAAAAASSPGDNSGGIDAAAGAVPAGARLSLVNCAGAFPMFYIEEIADCASTTDETNALLAGERNSDKSLIVQAADVGKVHGSLARAGKVKGQTPKVEKQEKKKKAVGRAKKRLQYTRRFVNAVAGFGGKRRMNPNDGGNK
ncbi:hypothetical protein HDU84_005701 [Entophlyctis sp. JEL0112]|nr:hypothetical protein HDU84_005701 [Entophlyctis sp. JEL0112]